MSIHGLLRGGYVINVIDPLPPATVRTTCGDAVAFLVPVSPQMATGHRR